MSDSCTMFPRRVTRTKNRSQRFDPRKRRFVCQSKSLTVAAAIFGMARSSSSRHNARSLPGSEVAREEISGGEGNSHASVGSEGAEVEVGRLGCYLAASK
jgi:hypothetical protein